ncbi:MAG: hypothetical protein ACREMT_12055, partial [Vulcanimicrobiaceae bacterium]
AAPERRHDAHKLDLSPLEAGRSSGIPFRIRKIQRCDFKSKRATLIVDTEAVSISADLFEPEEGESFVAPASIRDSYTGKWRRNARFTDNFAKDILERLRAQLERASEANAA